jgi:hypothetical protein
LAINELKEEHILRFTVTVPEVKGGSVYYDVTGEREGFCCEQHPQWKIQGPERQKETKGRKGRSEK